MGLSFFNAPDLKDYINSNFATSKKLSTFNSSADFYAELGIVLSSNYQLGFEYNLNIYSFNAPIGIGLYDLSLNQHKPSLIGYYYVAGEGYKFKFGIGGGLRTVNAEEELYGSTNDYSTKGFGGLLKLEGDTKLSGNFYALIAGEVRYDRPGELQTLSNSKIGLTSLGVGLKLGVVFYL